MSLLPRPGREMKEQEVRPSNEMHDQIGEVLVGDFKIFSGAIPSNSKCVDLST